jgi:hypothetical protein
MEVNEFAEITQTIVALVVSPIIPSRLSSKIWYTEAAKAIK